MRIAFAVFDDFPDCGAVGRRVQMLAAGLASRGHEVHIAVSYKLFPGPLSESIEGVKVHWGACTTRRAVDSLPGQVKKEIPALSNGEPALGSGP